VILLQLLAIALLVVLNVFFVASEFAIVKVRSSQLAALTAQGNRRARFGAWRTNRWYGEGGRSYDRFRGKAILPFSKISPQKE
jgi:cyclin M-like protein